jgi:hypothetical protein
MKLLLISVIIHTTNIAIVSTKLDSTVNTVIGYLQNKTLTGVHVKKQSSAKEMPTKWAAKWIQENEKKKT